MFSDRASYIKSPHQGQEKVKIIRQNNRREVAMWLNQLGLKVHMFISIKRNIKEFSIMKPLTFCIFRFSYNSSKVEKKFEPIICF